MITFGSKESCKEKTLSNIFKTTNVAKLTKALILIPKSSYTFPQESPYLIFCMIIEAKYFCSYILLINQISLSGCFYFVR